MRFGGGKDMSVLSAPPFGGYHSFRRFTVDEYHHMIRAGVLEEDDPVELLEGYLVVKMPRNPPHEGTIDLTQGALIPHLPAGWFLRGQEAVTLSESEPEPDVAGVRGTRRSFLTRPPEPADIGILIEVADSSLQRDRDDKGRIYARASIPVYWIVNLVDRQVEVSTQPSGPVASPSYAQRQDYPPGSTVPLTLDGVAVAAVAVDDLLP
jgi:Uma2 family endonuclease